MATKRRTKRGEQLGTALGRLGFFNTTDLKSIGQSFFDAFDQIGITQHDLIEYGPCPEHPDLPTLPEPEWPAWNPNWDRKSYEQAVADERQVYETAVSTMQDEWTAEAPEGTDDPFPIVDFADDIDVASELIKELADRGFKIVRA